MDASLEELEKLLQEEEEASTKKTPSESSSVMQFIRVFDIKPGTTKIPTSKIYTKYAYWAKRHVSVNRKVKKTEFFRQFSSQFQSYRTGKQRYYLLDASFEINNIKAGK